MYLSLGTWAYLTKPGPAQHRYLQAAASAAELQERITNRRWKNREIARYCRLAEKVVFLHYTAFGKVWYGAKYSHRVWEQFARTFEK